MYGECLRMGIHAINLHLNMDLRQVHVHLSSSMEYCNSLAIRI